MDLPQGEEGLARQSCTFHTMPSAGRRGLQDSTQTGLKLDRAFMIGVSRTSILHTSPSRLPGSSSPRSLGENSSSHWELGYVNLHKIREFVLSYVFSLKGVINIQVVSAHKNKKKSTHRTPPEAHSQLLTASYVYRLSGSMKLSNIESVRAGSKTISLGGNSGQSAGSDATGSVRFI